MKLKILSLALLFYFSAAIGNAQVVEPDNNTNTGDTISSTKVNSNNETTVETSAYRNETTAKTNTSTKEKKDKEPLNYPRLKAGLRGGVNLSDMIYSHEPIERYKQKKRMIGLLGVFAEIPLGRTPISLRPEFTMNGRASNLKWLDVEYEFYANYIDLRLPIVWNFRFLGEKVTPYIYGAPMLNLPYDGSITYSAEDFPNKVTTQITSANIGKYDFTVMVGAGIEFRIDMDYMPIFLSFEGGYGLGMRNSFSPRELIENTKAPSNILNNFFGAELWRGKRTTRGIELTVGLSVPLDGKYLQRYRERRKMRPDTLWRVQYDTIIEPNDTIIVEREVPVIVEKRIGEYKTKECFTIEELYQMLEENTDIRGKRICMFDIKFNFDSYKIRRESEAPLNKLVKMMQDYPQMTVEVYGHTDSIGTPEYNQKLSENRANAVVEYLSKKGISPNRVRSFGYGLRYPIDSNSNEEGRFRNRRVEFEVITIGLKRKYED